MITTAGSKAARLAPVPWNRQYVYAGERPLADRWACQQDSEGGTPPRAGRDPLGVLSVIGNRQCFRRRHGRREDAGFQAPWRNGPPITEGPLLSIHPRRCPIWSPLVEASRLASINGCYDQRLPTSRGERPQSGVRSIETGAAVTVSSQQVAADPVFRVQWGADHGRRAGVRAAVRRLDRLNRQARRLLAPLRVCGGPE